MRGQDRGFTIFDGMILVAALAAGLGLTRTFGEFVSVFRGVDVVYRSGDGGASHHQVTVSDYMNRQTAGGYRPWIRGEAIYWGRQLAFWPGPTLTALTLATLGLSLRPARPPLRRVARRPGVAAGLALILALAATAVHCPQILIAPGRPPRLTWPDWWLEAWFWLPRTAGFAVAVSWVTLAAGGRWPSAVGWRDHLGVALGACWIAMALLSVSAAWLAATAV